MLGSLFIWMKKNKSKVNRKNRNRENNGNKYLEIGLDIVKIIMIFLFPIRKELYSIRNMLISIAILMIKRNKDNIVLIKLIYCLLL